MGQSKKTILLKFALLSETLIICRFIGSMLHKAKKRSMGTQNRLNIDDGVAGLHVLDYSNSIIHNTIMKLIGIGTIDMIDPCKSEYGSIRLATSAPQTLMKGTRYTNETFEQERLVEVLTSVAQR